MATEQEENFQRGVSDLWTCVNHVAIVVSDVGRSLAFYTDVVGMKQVLRPNFDRHGAWLTLGNIDLHLIKGRPAVHRDDDLIVSHIAITVTDMKKLKERFQKLNVLSRKNVSVPNPSDVDTGVVEQEFVRDPDGYYIEFCNCEKLENYLHKKMAEDSQKYDFSSTKSALTLGLKLKSIANHSKKALFEEKGSEISLESISLDEKPPVDPLKLENLLKRQKVYGDITQNATPEELDKLLRFFDNNVPQVIGWLENKVRRKGTRTFLPPAFYDRNGDFIQPPAFDMPASIFEKDI